MRRLLLIAAAALAAGAPAAHANPLALGPPSVASGSSPWAPGCGGPAEGVASSVNYAGAEIETHLAVNPTNPGNVVAFWQQDRWSDGGSHGNLAGRSLDGGSSWAFSAPAFSRCAGGTGTTGGYERATDPWLSFGPTGRLHSIAIGFDNSTARNAILASHSDDGGTSWSTPSIVRYDAPRAVGNGFNDKQTLTADPDDPDDVYATWQRITSPSDATSQPGYENAASYFSDAWFARSTDGGETWRARSIFKENGRFVQTIGNQVEVLPDGTLINGFNLIQAVSNRQGRRGYSVALLRSEDRGATWSQEPVIASRIRVSAVTDPDDGHAVRTGDILPDWAVDRSVGTETRGNVYVVWMDRRFNDASHNDILLARSTDGGRTWDAPVVVDQTPLGVDAFTAMVDVDAQGRVAVTYHDFRNDVAGDDALSTDVWIAHSHDGGETFASEQRLGDASFDMRSAPDARGYFVGDYTGLDHSGTRFHAAWVEANDGDLANPTDVLYRTAE